jgi:hypothetical protein
VGHYFYWTHHEFSAADDFEGYDFATGRWGWRAPIQDLVPPLPKGFVLEAPRVGSKPPPDFTDLGGVPVNDGQLFWRFPQVSDYRNRYKADLLLLALCLGFCLSWHLFKQWTIWLVKIDS